MNPDALRALADEYGGSCDLAAKGWMGEQGSEWSARNPVDVAGTDKSWTIRYGHPKRWIVHEALRGVPRTVRWFELGCSSGAHLNVLGGLGFSGMIGADLSLPALRRCDAPVVQADALHLPFADASVDGLTTSGTLMHLGPPPRLTQSMLEILRVTRGYFFFVEIWSSEPMFLSFGDLLPPAWVYPWDTALLPFFGDDWEVVYVKKYELLAQAASLKAPMCVMVVKRKGL